ncbi:MAG: sulfatase-like hydrolase/transferase, partial [Flavobacteriaceae bacterium]|nr:sulfatase-like hydrolase/transferase [Flavobacteriaceae bacterium]
MKFFYPFFLIFAIIFFSCSTNHKSVDRPNILFIMSDDHAYQAISAYDNRLIQTPNIDRIAKEGILFN